MKESELIAWLDGFRAAVEAVAEQMEKEVCAREGDG